MAIGLEKINLYPCALSLDIATLCAARGLDAENFCERLMCTERSVKGPFEDVVTLAVNAARPMLTDADRDAIRLLIVSTESAPDLEKPVSSWVHHHLGLRPDCRNFEVKHACYGATGALQLAMGWLLSGVDPGAKALIVNADHSLVHLRGTQEPVLGAGGVALLVSSSPRVVEYEIGWNGVWAHEVADIFRPAPNVETGNADESLLSYLDGVEHTYDAYVAHVGHPVDFDAFFAANVYHVPFGGLAQRAHLRLARRELGLSKADAERHWRRKSAASLTYNRRTGGLFGGATFIALASLIEQQPLAAGDRIGVYSYGSGSCAEFYSATVCDGARQTVAEIRLASQLDGRRPLSVEEYEACEREIVASTGAADYRSPDALIPGLWDSHYDGRGKLVFLGTRDHYREYAWS